MSFDGTFNSLFFLYFILKNKKLKLSENLHVNKILRASPVMQGNEIEIGNLDRRPELKHTENNVQHLYKQKQYEILHMKLKQKFSHLSTEIVYQMDQAYAVVREQGICVVL